MICSTWRSVETQMKILLEELQRFIKMSVTSVLLLL